jgi:hypothetical protein
MRKGYHWILFKGDCHHKQRNPEALCALADKLFTIGGRGVAFSPADFGIDAHDLNWFASLVTREGKLFEPSDARIYRGKVGRVTLPRARQCHNNTSHLYYAERIASVCSGWSLQPGEEIWHRHSWALSKTGKVWETTPPRRRCFGLVFDEDYKVEKLIDLTYRGI